MIFSILNWTSPEEQDTGGTWTPTTPYDSFINAAIATCKHVQAEQSYRIENTINAVGNCGQKIQLGNNWNSPITAPVGATFDMLRVGNAHSVKIMDGLLMPQSGQVGMRIYAGDCRFNDMRFMPATPGVNVQPAIVLADRDPANNCLISGAYGSLFDGLKIGWGGQTFATAIKSISPDKGQQDNHFINGKFIGDVIYEGDYGGASFFDHNRFQSTGTREVPRGVALKFGARESSMKVAETNYCEGYIAISDTANTSATEDLLFMGAVHNDGCTNVYTNSGGNGRRVILHSGMKRGQSPDNLQLFFTAHSQTKSITSESHILGGNGVPRTGCAIGPGSFDGQPLRLQSHSYNVQILNTGIRFASNAASATFGPGAGCIGTMTLQWDNLASKWLEMARTPN